MIKQIDLKELYMGFDKPSNVDESLARINQKIEVVELKINEMIKEINSLRDGVSTLGGKGSVKPII